MSEKHGPKVSIVMPTYNAEAFIGEAICSVLSQSVTDFELIVIDDGSNDNTQNIVSAFMRKDARITLVTNKENMGVARTRNRGLDLCRGKYIALLDSDDYWEPCFLEKMIAQEEKTKADLIYCSYAIVNEQGTKICSDFIVPEKTTFRDSIVRNVISCSTVLFASDYVKQCRFPLDVYHEDIALWFQILRDGGTACGVTDVLASYRQRADSRASNKFKSACRRWTIYRKHLKMSIPETVYVMAQYAYYGFKKYRQI